MELPKIQPNLMSMLTEFRDLYGFDPMQQSWEEHLRGDAIDQDQVCDMMTSDKSVCCDSEKFNQGFCGACSEHD